MPRLFMDTLVPGFSVVVFVVIAIFVIIIIFIGEKVSGAWGC